jgi:hypothetical protein
MIIAHIGLDGSGKSYGMAMDALTALRRGNKEVWSLTPILGARQITDPHQIIYLKNSVIFLDELQRWFPPKAQAVDEIMQHIISTHRHEKNVIHWASQDFSFVNWWIRHETSLCWMYEAIHRDKITGESNWFNTGLHRHSRRLITGVSAERGYSLRLNTIEEQKFWIKKKVMDAYNSFGKINVVIKDPMSADYLANLVDPNYSAPYSLPDENSKSPSEKIELERDQETYSQSEGIERENESDKSDAIGYIRDPGSYERGKW